MGNSILGFNKLPCLSSMPFLHLRHMTFGIAYVHIFQTVIFKWHAEEGAAFLKSTS